MADHEQGRPSSHWLVVCQPDGAADELTFRPSSRLTRAEVRLIWHLPRRRHLAVVMVVITAWTLAVYGLVGLLVLAGRPHTPGRHRRWWFRLGPEAAKIVAVLTGFACVAWLLVAH